jgi:hypothetical protein
MRQADLILILFILVTAQWVMFLLVGMRLAMQTQRMKHLEQDIQALRPHLPPRADTCQLPLEPQFEDEGYEYNCTRKDLAEYCP